MEKLRVYSRRQKSKTILEAPSQMSTPDSSNPTPTNLATSILLVNYIDLPSAQRKRVRSCTQRKIVHIDWWSVKVFMGAKSPLLPYYVRLCFISDSREHQLQRISHFGLIAQMWLTFSQGHHKWYQGSLVTLCGAEALHDVSPNEDVRNLSRGVCDTQKVSHKLGR